MIDKNRGRWKFRLPEQTSFWLAVQVLFITTLMTLPLVCIASTNAKYIASGESSAGGRVAKWDVVLAFQYIPAGKIEIPAIPAAGTVKGHPLVLFFEGRTADPLGIGTLKHEAASFPAKFTNNSEVTARFTPCIKVDAPTDASALAVVKSKIRFMDGSTDVTSIGLVIPPGEERDVDVVIQNCTFTNLKVGAICEQVN